MSTGLKLIVEWNEGDEAHSLTERVLHLRRGRSGEEEVGELDVAGEVEAVKGWEERGGRNAWWEGQ